MVTVYDGKSLRHKYQNIEDTEYSTERWELRSDQEQVENEMSIETLDRSDRDRSQPSSVLSRSVARS